MSTPILDPTVFFPGPYAPTPFDEELEAHRIASIDALFNPEWGWIPVEQKKNPSIQSYSKLVGDLPTPWLKSSTTLPTDITTARAILSCLERRKLFQERFGEFKYLQVFDYATVNIGLYGKFPWPMTSREWNTIERSYFIPPYQHGQEGSPQEEKNSLLVISKSTLSDSMPIDPNKIRAEIHMNSYYLTPNKENPQHTDLIWVMMNDLKFTSFPDFILKGSSGFLTEIIDNLLKKVIANPKVVEDVIQCNNASRVEIFKNLQPVEAKQE